MPDSSHSAEPLLGGLAPGDLLSSAPSRGDPPLYQQIARQLEHAMASGALRIGDRLPSVRQLSRQHRVSMTTALQVYRHLENERRVEARPKSGYFVSPPAMALPEPQLDARMNEPAFVAVDEVLHDLLQMMDDTQAAPTFCAAPHRALLPEAKLQRIAASINRLHPEYASLYQMAGSAELCKQIARRAVDYGVHVRPEEIIVTNGGVAAVNLALRSVASPGDTIAIESPTYFVLLKAIESLGMKALEIPTHPRDGISIEALDLATQRPGAVKACALIPNFHNPLGSVMPEENKRRLVALMAERGIPVIENDTYGDLHFGPQRPRVLQSYSQDGNVILCSSFTKTIAPGYRVGWMSAGRYRRKAETMKLHMSLACPSLPQEVIAAFIGDGGYDHHLRKLRAALKQQARQMADAVARYFPPGCRLSLPQGGYMLWIELPRHVDSREVFKRARDQGIGLTPGAVCTSTRRFDHFIRVHYGSPWSERMERGVERLGRIVAEL
jgi:DNA-binding transcriptional MocR family regulator